MGKKKTILDELVAGLGGILLIAASFGGYTIFSILAYGATDQNVPDGTQVPSGYIREKVVFRKF